MKESEFVEKIVNCLDIQYKISRFSFELNYRTKEIVVELSVDCIGDFVSLFQVCNISSRFSLSQTGQSLDEIAPVLVSKIREQIVSNIFSVSEKSKEIERVLNSIKVFKVLKTEDREDEII